eukprot:TRINITY_DN80680_c0_g1_i1.p1 TRINITY_DN80680_c0_g1~~TRINITY_DN80680_c0_g1_i1.p1  ORF type:complete len:235 (-),score=52.75 TRINITY_DN80680_c0_g1_i1:40-666(-)
MTINSCIALVIVSCVAVGQADNGMTTDTWFALNWEWLAAIAGGVCVLLAVIWIVMTYFKRKRLAEQQRQPQQMALVGEEGERSSKFKDPLIIPKEEQEKRALSFLVLKNSVSVKDPATAVDEKDVPPKESVFSAPSYKTPLVLAPPSMSNVDVNAKDPHQPKQQVGPSNSANVIVETDENDWSIRATGRITEFDGVLKVVNPVKPSSP